MIYFRGFKHDGQEPVIFMLEGPYPGESWRKPFASGPWSEATALTADRVLHLLDS